MTVDILLPTSNQDKEGLKQTLDSLSLSRFQDFRVLLINDSDAPLDPRYFTESIDIELVECGRRLGLTGALKLSESSINSKYIARVDCADIVHPDRLAAQFSYLEEHREVCLVGCKSELVVVDRDGAQRSWHSVSSDDISNVSSYLLWRNPFVHGSIMMRTDAFRAVDGYSVSYKIAQDFNLYMKLRSRGTMYILPDVLNTHFFSHHRSRTINRNRESIRSSLKSRFVLAKKRDWITTFFVFGVLRDVVQLLLPRRILKWIKFKI